MSKSKRYKFKTKTVKRIKKGILPKKIRDKVRKDKEIIEAKDKRTILFKDKLTENATSYELTIREYLKSYNILYVFQKVFYTNDDLQIPMIVDFYLPNRRIIIEVDGNQHLYDKKQLWKDEKRDEYFKKLGIRTIRILNSDLKNMTPENFKKLFQK